MSMEIYLTNSGPHPAGLGGVQRLYQFPNGYGASVVSTPYTYGGENGLWELAVLNRHGVLDYSTPVTSDVLGWLTPEEVETHLITIAALQACPEDCPTHKQAAQARRAQLTQALAALRTNEPEAQP
jgi:hypothetical protein